MESLRRIYQRAGYQQAHSRHLSLLQRERVQERTPRNTYYHIKYKITVKHCCILVRYNLRELRLYQNNENISAF